MALLASPIQAAQADDPSGEYAYNYEFPLGTAPLMTPEMVMDGAAWWWIPTFPFDEQCGVTDNNSQAMPPVGTTCDLINLGLSNPTYVAERNATNFKFDTRPGHFEGEGRFIRFSFHQDSMWNLSMKVHGWGDWHPQTQASIESGVIEAYWHHYADVLKAKIADGSLTGPPVTNERERITRRALQCAEGDANEENNCFEPKAMRVLAGDAGDKGAVGDSDQALSAACADADYLDQPGYARTRAEADARIRSCISNMRANFTGAVTQAGSLVNVMYDVNETAGNCFDVRDVDARCRTLRPFGVELQSIQDFYLRSNYTDSAEAPYTATNPPGLGLTAPSSLLDMVSTSTPTIPSNLTLGCAPSTANNGCDSRIKVSDLSKDHGEIALPPSTWTGYARSARGQMKPAGASKTNFQTAVDAAVAETKRQWGDFKAALRTKYGDRRGRHIACALTHDNLDKCEPGPANMGVMLEDPETGNTAPIGWVNWFNPNQVGGPVLDNSMWSIMGLANDAAYAHHPDPYDRQPFHVIWYAHADPGADFDSVKNKVNNMTTYGVGHSSRSGWWSDNWQGQSNNQSQYGPIFSNGHSNNIRCAPGGSDNAPVPTAEAGQGVFKKSFICQMGSSQ
ncbi:hypothetical protein [Streptomyces sp. CB02009]|uniref:hypothetical protein n=1 Tax=Streptomyces sp. CB02009 TaxID=1703938 RepID=UPI0011610D5D|nr:hypothetical protein [Streptomyces sp. CB02009]